VIVPSLAARGILDEDILTDDVVAPMHAAATVLHLARQWPQASQEYVARLEAAYEQIKQTTWDRIDLATAPQDTDTPDIPTPGAQGPRYMGLTR
jgi:DNA-binding ferritin-like protein